MVLGILALIGIGALLFFIIIAAYFVGIYNSLIKLKNDIEKAWANIDVLLKQRSDELPKLIDTVKGYIKHEKSLLVDLTNARTEFLNAKTFSEKAKADNMLSGTLKSIFAVSENYPNLKANENFKQLQERISGIENSIADRREFYNDSVNNFNIRIESFPDMFIANNMKLVKKEMFKVTEAEKQDVKIAF